MELLRLQKISESDLDFIRKIFDELDEGKAHDLFALWCSSIMPAIDGNGFINLNELESKSFFSHTSGIFKQPHPDLVLESSLTYNSLLLPYMEKIQQQVQEEQVTASSEGSTASMRDRAHSAPARMHTTGHLSFLPLSSFSKRYTHSALFSRHQDDRYSSSLLDDSKRFQSRSSDCIDETSSLLPDHF